MTMKLFIPNSSALTGRDIVLFLAMLVLGAMIMVATVLLQAGILLYGLVLVIGLGAVTLGVLVSLRHGAFYALILLIIAGTVYKARFGLPIEPEAPAVALLMAILFLTVPRRFTRWSSYPLLLPIICYLTANLVASLLYSPTRGVSLRETIVLAARACSFFFVVIAMQRFPDLRSRIPNYLLILLFIHTCFGLVGLALYPLVHTPFVLYGQDGGSSLAINGFFLEPNLYGIYALCVVELLIAQALFSTARQRQKLFWAIGVGLVGIVLGYTRSTWLGFIVVFACLGIYMLARPSTYARQSYITVAFVLGIGAACLILVLLAASLLQVQNSLVQRFSNIANPYSSSATGRIVIWLIAFKEWRQHIWLGSGPLSLVAKTGDGWLFSSIIQTLHDSGILGMGAMLAICGGGMLYSWRAFYAATTHQDRGILLGYLLAQIALFFTSQFSSLFWSQFTWTLLGLAVGHSLIVLKQHTTPTVVLFPSMRSTADEPTRFPTTEHLGA